MELLQKACVFPRKRESIIKSIRNPPLNKGRRGGGRGGGKLRVSPNN